MDTTHFENWLAKKSHLFRKSAPLILIVSSLISLGLISHLATHPPSFQTDLNDFAPEGESNDVYERLSNVFPNESRPMFVHVTADDGGNVLAMDHIQTMLQDLNVIESEANKRNSMVVEWTTTTGILQTALDEEANSTPLSTITSWEELIDLILEEDQRCTLGANDQFLSMSTYISSALLNKDLEILSRTCQYLTDGTTNAEPFASSTLWVLNIDPDMAEDQRRELQAQLREVFAVQSGNSTLNYDVISNDLITYDIDANTFNNLIVLISLAVVVVLAMLYIAFRSIKEIAFPFVGLSFALIWTYGILNLVGARFTVLEATVAPLVLGLGIDYAIHLQRAKANASVDTDDTAEAWLRSCARLSIPLTLAVVTTIAAFLANIVSPLPPIATLGYALSLGVFNAFITSIFVVGSLHVMFSKDGEEPTKAPQFSLPKVTDSFVNVQQKQQVLVLLIAILISGLSIYGAASLETNFDLADFVDQDLEIMEVRDELAQNYDSAGWKIIYVFMEPLTGEESIPGDEILLAELRGFHFDLKSNHDVVGTDYRLPSPSYEGPYTVLRDAILYNESFGYEHNLEVFGGDVYVIDTENPIDLGKAFGYLASNQTIADPLTGKSWEARVSASVALENENIVYLRHEIRVEASTSAQSSRVVSEFQKALGSEDDSGTLKASLSNHAQIYIAGDLVNLQTILDGLSLSQLRSTGISLIFSFAVLLIITRRIMPAIIVLFPVGVASLWVVGSMAVLGLKWNVLTVMVTALTLGIGIDYSIHMWRRIEVEMDKKKDHWEALRASLNSTGVALMLSAITTMFGFAVLLLSPMPVIQDFGLVTAVTVLFSLLLSLFLLPVLAELTARGDEAKEALLAETD